MKITLVAGARPNFMKIAPIIRAIEALRSGGQRQIHYRLVHTGQHYDDKLSQVFFRELGLPQADVNLGAGSGTQAEQTAKIMVEFERDLLANPTDLVVVVGDVTSTMACTIVAKKLNTRVAHVEGGIRSFDMSMPEEVNRIVTDSLADYFFTTGKVANQNLIHSGVSQERIFFVGNTMIDSLKFSMDKLRKPAIWDNAGLDAGKYFVLTLHRPSNVDDAITLKNLLKEIEGAVRGHVVIFPIHPRTRKNFDLIAEEFSLVLPTDPMSYFEFIYLIRHATAVVTDSGGIQEETTVLDVPCITLRSNTERPETVSEGTNELIGHDMTRFRDAMSRIFSGQWKKGGIPELWDGRAAERIVAILADLPIRVG